MANPERRRQLEKDQRARNHDKIKKSNREWRERNLEREKARSSAYFKENPEKSRAYAAAHRAKFPEKVKKRKSDYYKKESAKCNAKAKEWVKNNPERRAQICAKWQKNNPEKGLACVHRRLARKLNNSTPHQIAGADAWILEMKSFPDHECAYCAVTFRVEIMQVDHIMPMSKGGAHCRENLTIACSHCNQSKNNRILYKEWIPPKDRPAPEDIAPESTD